jgi:hypothetical protein
MAAIGGSLGLLLDGDWVRKHPFLAERLHSCKTNGWRAEIQARGSAFSLQHRRIEKIANKSDSASGLKSEWEKAEHFSESDLSVRPTRTPSRRTVPRQHGATPRPNRTHALIHWPTVRTAPIRSPARRCLQGQGGGFYNVRLSNLPSECHLPQQLHPWLNHPSKLLRRLPGVNKTQPKKVSQQNKHCNVASGTLGANAFSFESAEEGGGGL